MDSIHLENYRCFHQPQEARLGKLTLLVGGNSTGKTSFLALIRILWDMAYGYHLPDFKEEPFDLGSFDEIAHHRGARGGRSEIFKVGFDAGQDRINRNFSFSFGKKGSVPVLTGRCLTHNHTWIEATYAVSGQPDALRVGTNRGSWKISSQDAEQSQQSTALMRINPVIPYYFIIPRNIPENHLCQPLNGSSAMGEKDWNALQDLAFSIPVQLKRPFATAPVRSRPRRTYDPARSLPDPEGENTPMLLAETSLQNKENWQNLKFSLEEFGKASGLFDEIRIRRPLGKSDSDPFQIQTRKFGEGSRRAKGPYRNLIDVGYGVSQILPIITELFLTDSNEGLTNYHLLQQPEVHLHPQAQAELGSLLCQKAATNNRLVVETHSDHLMDRVRMDVRDGKSALKPEDVSILFFERSGLEVNIHSLGIDGEGNILDAPQGYRKFFMEEIHRSLGL